MNEKDYTVTSRRWSSEWSRYAKREGLEGSYATVRGHDLGDGKRMIPQMVVWPKHAPRLEWFLAGEHVILNGNSYLELAGTEPGDVPYGSDCQLMLFSWEVTP